MRGITKIVSIAILAALTLTTVFSFTLWFKGIVGQYMRDISVKLYVLPLKVFDNGTMELYIKNYGRSIMVDYIVLNGMYEMRPYKVKRLDIKSNLLLDNNGTILIPEGASLELFVGTKDLRFKPGEVYELFIHTVDGSIYITNIRIDNIVKSIPENKMTKAPWMCEGLMHRIVVRITSKYNRFNYPIPMRLNLTQLGFKEYLNESAVTIISNDTEINYSITRVANNTYWLVINTSLHSNDPVTIEIYFNTSKKPNTLGKPFGNLKFIFPLPCEASTLNLASNYEVEHIQIDYGNSDYEYVLLVGKYPIFSDGETIYVWNISDYYVNEYYIDNLDFFIPFYNYRYNTLYISKYFRIDLFPWQQNTAPTSSEVYEDEFVNHKVIAVGWTYITAQGVNLANYRVEIRKGIDHGMRFREYVWRCTIFNGVINTRVWIAESGDIQMNIYEPLSYVVAGISSGEGVQGQWLAFMASQLFDEPPIFSDIPYCSKVTYEGVCTPSNPLESASYYFLIVNLKTLRYDIINVS